MPQNIGLTSRLSCKHFGERQITIAAVYSFAFVSYPETSPILHLSNMLHSLSFPIGILSFFFTFISTLVLEVMVFTREGMVSFES